MNPLTDDEAALLYTVQMWGSAAYPIGKYGPNKWHVGPWRSWKGFPTVDKTKRRAVARFDGWQRMALERWAEFKQTNPNAILTAVGVKNDR